MKKNIILSFAVLALAVFDRYLIDKVVIQRLIFCQIMEEPLKRGLRLAQL